jgi:hypothetical protein
MKTIHLLFVCWRSDDANIFRYLMDHLSQCNVPVVFSLEVLVESHLLYVLGYLLDLSYIHLGIFDILADIGIWIITLEILVNSRGLKPHDR